MPFTLAEHAAGQKEPLKKGVFLGIVKESAAADLLTFKSQPSLTVSGVRYDGVIEPDFIPINGTIAEKTVRGKNLSYGVYQMAVHIDIPRVLEADQGVIEHPSTRQAKMAIEGAAYKFNDVFVNGDHGRDANEFEGLEKLVSNMGASQTIGATEIDISGAPTDSTMQSFIDRLDETIFAVNGHNPTFGLCNSAFGQRFRSVARRLKLPGDHYDWLNKGWPFGTVRMNNQTKATKPMFVYNDIPFYDIGVKADQSTNIIGSAYSEGGSSTATRVYLCKLGDNDVEGLQFAPPNVRKIADTLEDKEVTRHRFTWTVGMGVWRGTSIAKMQGVKVKA